MKCNKCGNELKIGQNFCTKCGTALKNFEERQENEKTSNNVKQLNKLKRIVLLVVLLGVIGFSVYCGYKKSKQVKLENEVDEIVEEKTKNIEEQKNYDLIYKTKISKAKEECIRKIKEELFNKDQFSSATVTPYSSSATYITPQDMKSIEKILVCLDTTNEQVLRIGMRITYTGKGEFVQDIIPDPFNATGIIDAELDLVENKFYWYYAEGGNSIHYVVKGKRTDFDRLEKIYALYPYAVNSYPNIGDEYIYANMDKEPLKYKDGVKTNSNENSSRITGLEQAVKDGKLKEKYVTIGITEDKLRAYYYEGVIEEYYNTWEECLADAQKLDIIITDISKYGNLTGIERAVEEGRLGDDYITEGVSRGKLQFEFQNGNLQYYYDTWEECLADAQKLNIITSNEEYIPMGQEMEQSTQKAIDLIKKKLGGDETVNYEFDYINENGEYIISVKDKVSNTVKYYYRVNLDTETVEID